MENIKCLATFSYLFSFFVHFKIDTYVFNSKLINFLISSFIIICLAKKDE